MNETNETVPARSAALIVGEAMLRQMTESLGVTEEEAAMLLMEGGLPDAGQTLSLRAAEALAALADGGGDPETYMGDGEFIASLKRMPVGAAIELADARRGAGEAGEKAKSELMEQLMSRRRMPASMRTAPAEGAGRDYAGMSGEEFNALRERFRREALNGKKPNF